LPTCGGRRIDARRTGDPRQGVRVTSDHLIAAQIVPADGRLIQCDEDHGEDLFWAIGGAGELGVVTSLVFRTVPAPDVTNLHLAWPFSRRAG
jgi:FAD/FMN-containing dehydrogenase